MCFRVVTYYSLVPSFDEMKSSLMLSNGVIGGSGGLRSEIENNEGHYCPPICLQSKTTRFLFSTKSTVTGCTLIQIYTVRVARSARNTQLPH